ncbi:hypothetical protein HAX54_051482 [Datura stramonium]|uniref:Uncharacterized protein n=1 Tax=Datura stramonium TaxID=4076 RepID=A0ABS8WQD7_DATST|nr:hypothetical protein [Datura stramonium]
MPRGSSITCDLDLNFPFFGSNDDDLEVVKIGGVSVFDGHIGSAASEMALRLFLDKFLLRNYCGEHPSNYTEFCKSSLVETIEDIDLESSKMFRSGGDRLATFNYKFCRFLNEVEDCHSDPSLLAQKLIQKAFLGCSTDNLSVLLVPPAPGGPAVDDLPADLWLPWDVEVLEKSYYLGKNWHVLKTSSYINSD